MDEKPKTGAESEEYTHELVSEIARQYALLKISLQKLREVR